MTSVQFATRFRLAAGASTGCAYDPLIPADSVRLYAEQVQRSGSSANFVQQYVKHDGHCRISGPEIATALQELIQWKHTGKKLDSGALPEHVR